MRRGILGLSYTAWLIFTLASFVVVLFMVKGFAGIVDVAYDKGACKTSVIANSKLRVPYAEFQNIEVSCPTRYATVTEDKIEVESGDKVIDTIRINCGTGKDFNKECFLDRINPTIARLLFDCWDQFAAGRLQLFSSYKSDRQCLICSRIFFKNLVDENHFQKEKFISGQSDELAKHTLDEYLKTHKPISHTISYYDFLKDKVDDFYPPFYDYEMDKSYGIVFVALNQHAIPKLVGTIWDKFKYLITDVEENPKEPFTNTLEFEEYSKITELCETQV